MGKFDADSFFLRCTRPIILQALLHLLAVTAAETGASGVTLMRGRKGYIGGIAYDRRRLQCTSAVQRHRVLSSR